MIVLARRRIGRQHPQAPRHPQVHDQMTIPAFEQQIFAPALDCAHGPSGKVLYFARDWPTQPWFPDPRTGYHPSCDVRRDSAAGDFYFGKLWHGAGLVSGGWLLVWGAKYT